MQQAALPDGFDAFWSAYPIHRAKADAVKAWRQVSPVPLPTILAKLPIQIANDDSWLRGFVPLPGTYLRGSRWLDDIAKPTGVASERKLSAVERVEAAIRKRRASEDGGSAGPGDARPYLAADGSEVWGQLD